MKIGPEGRTNILIVVTAVLVSYTRHAISTRWAPWEGLQHSFGHFFIHYIALWFVIGIGSQVIDSWHQEFTGEKAPFGPFTNTARFHTTALIFLVTAAILFFYWVPEGTFGSSDD